MAALCLSLLPVAALSMDVSPNCPLPASSGPIQDPPAQLGETFQLLSWNLQKASNRGWSEELSRFGRDADLLILQEATLESELLQQLPNHGFGTFAEGYSTGSSRSGVATLSRSPALAHCALHVMEPWLGTPKAVGFSLYGLQQRPETLLAVNIHGVNFTLGINELSQQLNLIGKTILEHNGPVIVAGDFNTWNDPRSALLEAFAREFGLESVGFSGDQRTRFLGSPLDHVLVRGLEVLDSQVPGSLSSDHNPLLVTLSLQKEPDTDNAPR